MRAQTTLFWILLALLPSASYAAKQPRLWLDRNFELVDADSDSAYYYAAPPTRDGELWRVTLYFAESGEEAVPAVKTQLDGPDLASAHQVGEYTSYYPNGSVKLRGTLNENRRWQGEFTRYRENGHYTVSQFRNGVLHGSKRHFYADGQLEIEVPYIDGEEQDGERICYNEDGQVKLRYSIVDGEKHGVQEYFRDDGVIYKRVHYKHGKYDGLVQRFSRDGQKIFEANYVDDERLGAVREWHEGQLTRETYYRANKRHGTAKRWEDGVLVKALHYVDGRKRGEAHYYYQDGSPESYEHRNKEGELTERREYNRQGGLTQLFVVEDSTYGPAERKESYRDDGSLSRRTIYSVDRRWILEERYRGRGDKPSYRRETVDGDKHGLQISGNPQPGGIGSYDITRYQHGLAVGDYREVDRDGKVLSHGQYERGKQVGDWVRREYGTTVYESYDSRGRRHGERRRELDDGLVLERSHYVAGELHGEQVKRERDGRLTSRGEYRHGVKVGTWQEYDEYAKGLFEGEYVDGKRHGLWLARSPEGYEMARLRFEHGVPVGKNYIFARNGSVREVTPYKDGKRHGRHEKYRDGTLVAVEPFRNGRQHGVTEYFLSNGERYMAEEYDNGTYVRSLERDDSGAEEQ
ncbi:toxin-antitoxin system YwqK family antitoxin [Microbulbifer litoralis]|uniref:toxin-antitoxin system YwqK family antitoxin n=1 Tax=Microbulbifer litoralis TaxID=2933965 RepID=UPI0020291328|nr:hypothetical protein [Microbulbifer sp. GX H0434]